MSRRSERGKKGVPPDLDTYVYYDKHTMAKLTKSSELVRSASEAPLPVSPDSISRSSNLSSNLSSSSSGSSRQRRLLALAELEAAEKLAEFEQEEAERRLRLEREEADRRIARQREIVSLQLAATKAEIEENASSGRSARSARLSCSSISSSSGEIVRGRSLNVDAATYVPGGLSKQDAGIGSNSPAVATFQQSKLSDVVCNADTQVGGQEHVQDHAHTEFSKHTPADLQTHRIVYPPILDDMQHYHVPDVESNLRRQLQQQQEEFSVRERAYQLNLQQALERERTTFAGVGDSHLHAAKAMEEMVKEFAECLHAKVPVASSSGGQMADGAAMQHFMARQTVGKELPTFSGQPEEWPTFAHLYKLTTDQCGFSDAENIVRLQRSLRGKAKEAVAPMLTLPENVTEVLKTLELRFGRPELVISTLIHKAKACGNVKADDFGNLIAFSTAVQTLVATMKLMRAEGHMYNPQLRQELVSKLPPGLRMQWGEVIQASAHSDVSLSAFASWLSARATAASCVHVPRVSQGDYKVASQKSGKSEVSLTTTEESGAREQAVPRDQRKPSSSTSCAFCHGAHKISKCKKLEALMVRQRFRWVKTNHRCFSCLAGDHLAKDCSHKSECGVNGCKLSHHPLLHRDPTNQDEAVAACDSAHSSLVHQAPLTDDSAQGVNVSSEHQRVLLRVLPVVVQGPSGEQTVHALLDDASSVTLIDADLASELGATGRCDPLSLKWTNSIVQTDVNSQRVELSVRGVGCDEVFNLVNVRTRKNLALPAQPAHSGRLSKKWSHLRDISFPVSIGDSPRLLIGQDHGHLIVAREVIEGPPNAPMASRTKLGWVLHGNLSAHVRTFADPEFMFHTWEEDNHDALHQLVKDSFTTENFGVKLVGNKVKSRMDLRAEQLLEETSSRVGSRYETGLLWKDDNPTLPDSYGMAVKRLRHLERKLDRSPLFAEQYTRKILEYVDKGYARKLSPEECAVDCPWKWYLPHFGVFNENKPGKLRFVFDAAAKAEGVSLNDALLTGPDLLNPLVSVLMKFRQYAVAFGGDVREMFHQVNIRLCDQPAQHFLWRGDRRDGVPDVYTMQVMIFGAASSPTSAQYIMRRNALDFEADFPKVAAAVQTKFYMDDYFDSTATEAEAEEMIASTIEVQRRGGFHIHKWVSNSVDVLKTIPAEFRARGDVDFGSDTEMPVERALGLRWDPNSDCFIFTVHPARLEQISNTDFHFTKRSALSLVMSVFDPLGFVAAFTVTARVLLQDVWLSGIGWDDELPSQLCARWRAWCLELTKIHHFSMPRCYSVRIPEADEVTLHVFCDASTKAFAAVAYLRVEHSSGVVCSLVAAKTRVAPLKPMSIPRLELQAAVLGVRLEQMLREEHQIAWARSIFWTDSKTVLLWIRSDARRYKPFVAHRVGEICEASDPGDWHWIPTSLNVADDASRGLSIEKLCDGRWLTGPPFLRQSVAEWPAEKQEQNSASEDCDQEVKSEFLYTTVHSTAEPVSSEILPDADRFSKWNRLIRSTGWVLRFIRNILAKRHGNELDLQPQLSTEEFGAAEKLWWKQVQLECFPEEVNVLKASKPLSAQSRLRNLSPMLDDDGVVRLEGRLDHAEAAQESAKRPVILDPSHQFTRLLIHSYHEKARHQGQAAVLNELRQKYWILNGRAAVRRSWSVCQLCRNARSLPQVPVMAALPAYRLTPNVRAFSVSGVDYFGPFNVKVGRKTEKRYGVLFTCLVTRAVHLEVASSLTTSSCIMAIRRFISRRGFPKQIHSDNGTNLRGADRELKAALNEIDQNAIIGELTPKDISWRFNPPAAPHMGGAWERLVRSVKSILKVVLRDQSVTDETLCTVFAEAEAIVNSRPLTFVSVDPNDPEALTPNHFLLGSASVAHPPGEFNRGDLCLRKSWRTAQFMADQFWRRWVKEYLPEILRRTRWHRSQGDRPLAVGDVVVIADEKLPRGSWPLGRVTAVHPGADQRVRVVDVKTATGTYRRPVARLCKLALTSE